MAKAKPKPTTKAKTKAKTKPKKKAAPKMTPDECYNSFMKCVQKAEDAKTAKTRDKWLKAAQKDYKTLLKCEDELSSAQMKRIKRTKKFVDDLAADDT